MKPFGQGLAIAGLSLLALVAAGAASAQKSGGVLKIQHFDSPASMSILEELTRAALQPMMAVFNNLVIYDQNVKQNSLDSIVPDLATSWNWSEDGKELTFKLRDGVKWHDGKPFTGRCQMHLGPADGHGPGQAARKPAQILVQQSRGGHDQWRFRNRVPPEAAATGAARAARLGLVADLSVPRRRPRDAAAPDRHGAVQIRRIQAERIIKLVKNPDYWKKGRPYLDGIDFAIMREIAPRQSRLLCRRL